ncbi:glycosyltransferase family 2 protein [Solemya velesiana gill symbiont]|uniref:glycosyltransferase family 2 protein n=1 Tax=Solemya velesiana gill symbiont TaxID=1918948 RepID=UPI00156159B2|nr:glycosyltransferase family A protein [Solemya velesiana gill symbiont]
MKLNTPLRITEHNWPEGTTPLVSILCFTYNHEKYIDECLQGFLMQETTFSVEIIVVDDASVDCTAEIVRYYSEQYPKLFKPYFHKTNQYSQGGMPDLFAFKRSLGSYIATCDGDDFWSLPSKLERQVDIFEKSPDCILCGGRILAVREGDPFPYNIEPSIEPEKLITSGPLEMLKGQFIMRTPSRISRRWLWEKYTQKVEGSAAACDWLFTLFCISESKMMPEAFECLNEIVGTYREHSGGVWFTAEETAKMQSNLAVLMFALEKLDFVSGREVVEIALIHLAEEMNLTRDMNETAYDLYISLEKKYFPKPLAARIRERLFKHP